MGTGEKNIEQIYLKIKTIIMLLIIVSILIPSVRISGLPGIRLEQVIVIIMFLFLWELIFLENIITNLYFHIVIYLSLLIIISIINGFLNACNIIINDFLRYKVFIYGGIFLIASTLKCTKNDKAYFKYYKHMHFHNKYYCYYSVCKFI